MRLQGIAAGNTAGHAAAAMPRRPCRGMQCLTAGGVEIDDVHLRWWARKQSTVSNGRWRGQRRALVPAGLRCCSALANGKRRGSGEDV
jgi:hypothetical protein